MIEQTRIERSDEVLVKVEGLSKKFCKDLKTSLWYGVKDLVSGVSGNQAERTLRPKEFWAVKDVSFELRRGECLGLIGHNGAGKSTLLKILNGLINPDAGKVTMKGRVGALIELGAGFNPLLSGRENIYNNGAVLGFTRSEIDQKLQDIIAFSELEEFIDMPVQHYSSGMKVRLGFAVAAQMEPDVLIIDEVLAVGDVGFRIKCLNKIGELLESCAIIFVSHSMPQVARIATKGLLLEKGMTKIYDDKVSLVISKYYGLFSGENERILGVENLILESIEVNSRGNKIESNDTVIQGSSLEINIKVHWKIKADSIKCKLFFVNNDSRNVLDIPSELINENLKISNDQTTIKLETDPIFLNGGLYTLTLVVQDCRTNERLYRHDNLFTINVFSEYYSWSDNILKAKWSVK